jgi:hypothetical protein
VTAAGQLADAAPGAIRAPYAQALGAVAVVYGVPVLGFALLWLALAGAVAGFRTLRGLLNGELLVSGG